MYDNWHNEKHFGRWERKEKKPESLPMGFLVLVGFYAVLAAYAVMAWAFIP